MAPLALACWSAGAIVVAAVETGGLSCHQAALLVERVDLQPDGIDLHLRIEGLTSLCSELRTIGGSTQEAA
jgi:hypothetical protein